MSPHEPNRPTILPAGADVHTAASPTTPPASGPVRAATLQTGTQVGGYLLLQRIGRGGLGDVYRARSLATKEEVALKLLRTGDEASPGELRSFERECEVARRLAHPFILPILDSGVHDGCPFYTMPVVTGGSLDKRIRAGPMDPAWAAALLAGVARALDAAHRHGVLHRDLKPANILLAGNEPRVADFGLAKLLDNASGHTVSGQLLGSVPYMAPEQAAGQSHRARPATDVWSLGVILYEMLSGQRPFRGQGHTAILQQILRHEPPRLRELRPDVPVELERICRKCLEKDLQWRYASAAELASDLEAWLADQDAITTIAVQDRLPLLRKVRTRPHSALALSCLGLFAVAAALLLSQGRKTPAPVPTSAPSPEPGKAEALEEEKFAGQLRRVAVGESVALVTAGHRPRWSRMVLGEDAAKLTLKHGEPAWLNTPSIVLLELLPPDPARGNYRLTVDMAHIDGEAVSLAGVYAGRSAFRHADGVGHSLVQAVYAEPAIEGLDVKPPADPSEQLKTAYLNDGKTGTISPFLGPALFKLAVPANAMRHHNIAYRTLVLEVRSSQMSSATTQGMTRAASRRQLLFLFRILDRIRLELKAHQPDFSPAGGSGLVVYRGTIVVQRVLYEPLPARR